LQLLKTINQFNINATLSGGVAVLGTGSKFLIIL
jgi:hypothetical protein